MLVIEATGDAEFFKMLANVFFPFSPRIKSKEETAGSHSFVGHVAGGFGDEAVGPRKDIVDEEVVEIDDIVIVSQNKVVVCIV